MRYESSVTSLSWIPSEAVPAGIRVPFDTGILHYDHPPPVRSSDIAALRGADRFRFANVLRAWIKTRPTARSPATATAGAARRLGSTTVRPVGCTHVPGGPAARPAADTGGGHGWVRFAQTVGGRTGIPSPRRVSRPPYVQWQAPLVWTTLSLTLHADGQTEYAMTGASPFPRHWVYDDEGRCAQVRADRLPRLVPQLVRPAHPVGRPGLAGPGHRGGDRPGADPFRAADARRGQAEDPAAQGRRRPWSARASPAPRSTCVLDGVIRVERDGEGWPSTARARCWANGLCWKAVPGPRR